MEMQNNLSEKAIKAALEGKWKDAIEYNQAILRHDQQNIPALNRLGKALLELGITDEANSVFKKVLSLDKYNPIAKKNLLRLKSKINTVNKNQPISTTSSLPLRVNFLEEPGKTKTSQLVRLADADIIVNLHIGQPLLLEPRKRTVCLKTENRFYIGALPDDLSLRIGKLLRAGNRYEVLVKSIEGHSIQVFIREIHRSQRLKNTPSFPASTQTSYHADIRHALLTEEPLDISETGEEPED